MEYNYPSLNLIFELTKERMAFQLEQMNALDSRANFVLGSATALVSAAIVLQATIQAPLATSHPFYCTLFTNRSLHTIPLIVLLVIYLIVMITAYFAYRVRAILQAPEPGELYRTYLSEEESRTKAEVFRAMLEAYKTNRDVALKKLVWLNVSLICLVCEVVALVVYLVFQITC